MPEHDGSTADAPPEASRCLNCGARLPGRFCARCGQRADPPTDTVAFLAEWFEELVGLDGRLWRTLGLVLFRPGRLTVEVLAGRRARYVGTARLYLGTSVVSFLVFKLLAALPRLRAVVAGTAGDPDVVAFDLRDLPGTELPPDAAPWWRALAGVAADHAAQVRDDPWSLLDAFLEVLPPILVLTLPLAAAVVAVAFAGRRRTYLEHLVATVHVETAAMAWTGLAASVVTLARLVPAAEPVAQLLVPVVVFAWPVYLVVAFRRVYGGPWWSVVLRSAVVAAGWWFLSGVAALFAGAIGFLLL